MIVTDSLGICRHKRRGGARCNTPLVFRQEPGQNAAIVCPQCERTRRGVCLRCDAPVNGRVGYALWCAHHRKVSDRLRWRQRHSPKANPMPRPERSRLAGLIGGITRRERLSPERRSEIARMGGLARAEQFRLRREANAS